MCQEPAISSAVREGGIAVRMKTATSGSLCYRITRKMRKENRLIQWIKSPRRTRNETHASEKR